MEVVGDGVWDLDLYGFSFCGLVLTFSSPFISFHCLVLSCLVSSLLKEIGIRMLCISSHFSLSHHHLPSSLLSSLHPLSPVLLFKSKVEMDVHINIEKSRWTCS